MWTNSWILSYWYICNLRSFLFTPGLNDELVQLLLKRDELHMEQDAMLVEIEDLTRWWGTKWLFTEFTVCLFFTHLVYQKKWLLCVKNTVGNSLIIKKCTENRPKSASLLISHYFPTISVDLRLNQFLMIDTELWSSVVDVGQTTEPEHPRWSHDAHRSKKHFSHRESLQKERL